MAQIDSAADAADGAGGELSQAPIIGSPDSPAALEVLQAVQDQDLPVRATVDSRDYYLVKNRPHNVLMAGAYTPWGEVVENTNDIDRMDRIDFHDSRGRNVASLSGSGSSASMRFVVDTSAMSDRDRVAKKNEILALAGAYANGRAEVFTYDPMLANELVKVGATMEYSNHQGKYYVLKTTDRQKQESEVAEAKAGAEETPVRVANRVPGADPAAARAEARVGEAAADLLAAGEADTELAAAYVLATTDLEAEYRVLDAEVIAKGAEAEVPTAAELAVVTGFTDDELAKLNERAFATVEINDEAGFVTADSVELQVADRHSAFQAALAARVASENEDRALPTGSVDELALIEARLREDELARQAIQ